MEGKFVITSVVVLVTFLVLGQIQVEAQQFMSCCPSTTARNIYNSCRLAGNSERMCTSGCRRLTTCPPGWQHGILENTAVNEYCKSGCVSSVFDAITALQNSDASEVVNEAVEKCSNACSNFFTKGSVITAVETTA